MPCANLGEVLRWLVQKEHYPALKRAVTAEDWLSLVRFRAVTREISQVTQAKLQALWTTEEGIQGRHGQEGWDQLIRIRLINGTFTTLCIQSKNTMDGGPRSWSYSNRSAFPSLIGCDAQQLLLYVDVNGGQSNANGPTTKFAQVSDLDRALRLNEAKVCALSIGTFGAVG